MSRDREELIDFLLGELPPERAHEVAARVAGDPEAARERDLYADALGVLRRVAAEGWEAHQRVRIRRLRPAIAVAAVLLVALAFFWLDSGARGPGRIFEPDQAFGYLLPEETDASGRVREPATGDAYLVRTGSIDVGSIGSDTTFQVDAGETITAESEVSAPADTGARIDLPGGGILFLAPLATIQMRERPDRAPALRLVTGVACTVADGRPIHMAVNGSDLLLEQGSGAALLRSAPADAVCLRGDLYLKAPLDVLFKVPPGERLPAACASKPETVAVTDKELGLAWYRNLVYRSWRVEEVDLDEPLSAGPDTLVYLRISPRKGATLTVAFGGDPRRFRLHKGVPLELRLKLSDLGPGPRLEVDPAADVVQARLFEATPR